MGIIKALSSIASCHGCVGSQLSYPPNPALDAAGSQRGGAALDPSLSTAYEPMQLLGNGAASNTWLMRALADGQLYAVKLIPRPLPAFFTTSLLREITIQTQLAHGHINIVKPYEVLLTDKHVAIVMEFCAGNTMLSHLEDRVLRAQSTGFYMSEDEARYFFKQFIEALSYCHSHNVVHRDIKLENTLLDGNHPPMIKLSDFGVARSINPDDHCLTHVGTPNYMSPQAIAASAGEGYDGRATDVWASGVLLCVMLFGIYPYENEGDMAPGSEAWSASAQRSWADNPALMAGLSKLSDECRDLLDRIFVTDEASRLSVEAIQQHDWYIKPLLPRFQSAYEGIAAARAALEEQAGHQTVNPALAAARTKEIERLVALAAERVDSGRQLVRVDLRESSIMARPSFTVAE